jgi:pantetheine-phosphate adenylyltransferase
MAKPRCGSRASPGPAGSPEPSTGAAVRHGRASTAVRALAARFSGVSSLQRRCVCPGSYDPVTMGHVDVITRAAALYDEVVVAVLHNISKHGTFSVQERMKLLDLALTGVSNVRVEAFAGRLLVDVCREAGAQAIVKGLRSDTDFAYELPMALMNRHLSGVETVFLPGDPRFGHVSSSLIKDVAAFGGDITGLVPDDVRLALLDRLQNSEGS